MARFYVFLLVFAFLTSCREKAPSVKAGEKVYYLEFINRDGSNGSERTIAAVKRELFGNGFYYAAEPRGKQWITGVGYVDSVDVSRLDEHFKLVHRFKDISEYKKSEKNAEKIVITYNSPDKNKLVNFNFCSYKKSGHEEWQSVFNPGNFRFSDIDAEGEKKNLSVWMSELIVRLTFK